MKARRPVCVARPAAPGLNGCLTLGNWHLAPEGGIIHRGDRTAVIADVHLGYEWARGEAGDCVPAHSLSETLQQLDRLFARSSIERLVVAGDLVESVRPWRRTAAELARLRKWLDERAVRLVLLSGNHDRGLPGLIRQGAAELFDGELVFQDSLVLDGWTIVHGHCRVAAEKLIVGHFHPVLKVIGRRVPCFLANPSTIMLPAFSNNAAGLDVASAGLPRPWSSQALRCLASTGSEVLDFGAVRELPRATFAGNRR
jgi:putative SbcD/Mre11-related phosphoesterase